MIGVSVRKKKWIRQRTKITDVAKRHSLCGILMVISQELGIKDRCNGVTEADY